MSDPRATQDATTGHDILVGHALPGSGMSALLAGVLLCDALFGVLAVYCGSSNLALGGEQANGDNLLEIHDADVATAFTIEALLLVDHYNFLDSVAKKPRPTRWPPVRRKPTVRPLRWPPAGSWALRISGPTSTSTPTTCTTSTDACSANNQPR
jgi:hypothetical protein